MPFRLRADAEKWFSEVAGKEPFGSKFDIYYFCLVAGLSMGRSVEPSTVGVAAPVFVTDFIQDYRPAQRLIIGLLVTAELEKAGIDLGEKAAVRDVFKRLVAAEGGTGLTEEGIRRLNAYASGGYEELSAARDTKPNSPDEFLRDYVGFIGDAFVDDRSGKTPGGGRAPES